MILVIAVILRKEKLFGTMSEELIEEVRCAGWCKVLDVLRRLVSFLLWNESIAMQYSLTVA